MSQPIRISTLLAAPGAGFDQPFEMLLACHERVESMLRLLERLRAHLALHGADTQARQAAQDVLRYFDLAAPAHHLDEELHVFPPLLQHGTQAQRALVRQLQAEHVRMTEAWPAARAVLHSVAAGVVGVVGAQADADPDPLDDFARLYADHIAIEEQVAYPAAQALLDPQALGTMSAEMMRRRSIGWS